MSAPEFPTLTAYEEKVFAQFVANHKPGFHDHSIQLEGDKQLPVVAAGQRLIKKGVLVCHRSCNWYLTEIGLAEAERRQALSA